MTVKTTYITSRSEIVGLSAKGKRNVFFFYIKPIASAKSAVGWQTLEYIYDILMTDGVKAKQDKKKLKIEQ